jgi:hypothetical protein
MARMEIKLVYDIKMNLSDLYIWLPILACYQPDLSVMVQYFSLIINQRTVLFNLAF